MTLQIDPTKDLEEFLRAHASEAEAVEKNALQREPVFLTGLLSGPVFGLLTWLGNGADKESAQITGAIVTVLVILTHWVLRQYVSPWWKAHTGHELPSEVTDEQDPEPDLDADLSPAPFVPEMHTAHDSEQEKRLAGHPSPRGHHAADE